MHWEPTMMTGVSIISPFNNTISTFDNERSYPDFSFFIPGLEKPLRLHRRELGMASLLIDGAIRGQESPFVAYDPAKQTMEWIVKEGTINTQYRVVLLKWLRFCYGENQVFRLDECAVALELLKQLQLSCEEEATKTIESFMLESSEKCVEDADKAVTGFIQGRHVGEIEDFLMKVPAKHLNEVVYDEQSEFHVRARFVRYRRSLPDDEKCEVLRSCKQTDECSQELEALDKEGAVSCGSTKTVSIKMLKKIEGRLREEKKMVVKLAQKVEKMERVWREQALKKGGHLLDKNPDLKGITELTGKYDDLKALCSLLKGNAIPAQRLDLNGYNRI